MPKACKTQARKTLETSPTEPTKRIKGKKKDSLQALRHRKKHFYSQVRSSGIAPKSSRNLALENSSESLEQQQDSCPRHAKHKPIKLSKRRLRNIARNTTIARCALALENRIRKPQTAAGFVPKARETQARQARKEQQQDSSPCQSASPFEADITSASKSASPFEADIISASNS